jgi:hypothetical protein
MKEDYLWDRSGPSDPEIERLEETLAPLRYRPRAGVSRAVPARPRVWWAAAAAAVLFAAVLLRVTPEAPATAWQVDSFAGQARLGAQAAAVDMPLRAGQVLHTGEASELTLRADEFGMIDIGPDSQMRATTNRQVLLENGQLHAFIWARPREFVVQTPSARAVDLGCEYTINVDKSGDGLLRVDMGWVAFQYGDHESFIPAGAACVTRKRSGPGIPFFEDAPEPLLRSLTALEEGNTAALAGILEAARPEDGLTLWHLLTRVPERDRGKVFDRFAGLVALPPEVTREAVVRRDAHALDECWDALNLEKTEWWRGWERRWDAR